VTETKGANHPQTVQIRNMNPEVWRKIRMEAIRLNISVAELIRLMWLFSRDSAEENR
jgi:hypothetical protein